MTVTPFFPADQAGNPARIAIFMSGSGTNAEALLKFYRSLSSSPFEPVLLVTDNPLCRASSLAEFYGIPLLVHDIRAFYRERGEEGISLITPRRRELREAWTAELRRLLAPHRIDFVILAGFVPLSNITGDYPCLNVHPGDLTVERDGRRVYAGLHYLPVERAICDGLPGVRSSVILAQPYRGGGEAEMDTGPVLGVSEPVPVELGGETLDALRRIFQARTAGPHRDRLREIASANLERLKVGGDHRVLPPVVADFAAGRFGRDEAGRLCFLENHRWIPVKTVQYVDGEGVPVA